MGYNPEQPQQPYGQPPYGQPPYQPPSTNYAGEQQHYGQYEQQQPPQYGQHAIWTAHHNMDTATVWATTTTIWATAVWAATIRAESVWCSSNGCLWSTTKRLVNDTSFVHLPGCFRYPSFLYRAYCIWRDSTVNGGWMRHLGTDRLNTHTY